MIILGIDPGFGITGYGLIETRSPADAPELLEAGVLRSDRDKTLGERLGEIHSQLAGILKEFEPAALAVEDIFSTGAFPKSAILIGHIRGVVLLAASQRTVPVYSYYPLQVKKALIGNGNATKIQVQRMVETSLRLTSPLRPDDCSDALAVALCHASHVRFDGALEKALS